MDIRQVASRARVSAATVSRTIDRIPTVDSQFAKRVWKVVEELGYYPNSAARSLGSGRSRVLRLIVSEITNPFFPEVVQTFENLAVQHNYEKQACSVPARSAWKSAEKLEVARLAGGTQTINSMREPLHDGLLQMTEGRAPDVVIEAVGSPATFRAAVEEVSFSGRVVYLGYAKNWSATPRGFSLQKELDLMGSTNAEPEDFHDAIRLLETGRFSVDSAVTLIVPLEGVTSCTSTGGLGSRRSARTSTRFSVFYYGASLKYRDHVEVINYVDLRHAGALRRARSGTRRARRHPPALLADGHVHQQSVVGLCKG